MSESPEISVFLARSFRALRDVFIYLLPGGAFLALLLAASDQGFHLPEEPGWLVAALLLAACYIAGTFVAVLTYTLLAVLFPPKDATRLQAFLRQFGAEGPGDPGAKEELRVRHRFPTLFEEGDRLGLIANYRACLAGACLAGGAALAIHGSALHGGLAVLGGGLLFLNARSGSLAARQARKAALETGRALETSGAPESRA